MALFPPPSGAANGRAYIDAFPDLQITTEDLIAEDDKVTKVWTAHCTHKGDFMGIPATGKQVVQKGMKVYRIENGKIAEIWFCKDDLGVLHQVGAIPPPGN